MQSRLSFNKYLVACLGLLCCAVGVHAQYRTGGAASQPVHSLSLSLGGGLSMTRSNWESESIDLRDKAGGAALFGLSYEVSKKQFIFGVGVSVDYDYTRQRIDSFSDVFPRLDREGDSIYYAYRYRAYEDAQQRLSVSVPVYIGGYIGQYVYLLAGVKFSFPLLSSHNTETDLSTAGTYQRFIHTIENSPTYGYYPTDHYSYQESYDDAQWYLSPTLEIGSRFVLSRSVAMRIGAYAEYRFPFGGKAEYVLTDYSMVDENPHTLNQSNLRENIRFHSVPTCSLQTKFPDYWTVGIKWTCQFMFRHKVKLCRCVAM